MAEAEGLDDGGVTASPTTEPAGRTPPLNPVLNSRMGWGKQVAYESPEAEDHWNDEIWH